MNIRAFLNAITSFVMPLTFPWLEGLGLCLVSIPVCNQRVGNCAGTAAMLRRQRIKKG